MDIEILEELVIKAFDFADGYISFGFQGGEPTLRGIEFFEIFIELVKTHNIRNIKVNKYIQTNGILIDKDWADFLSKNQFLVGLSLDGPLKIHNAYRKKYNNEGSYVNVMKAVKLFNDSKVDYNILNVVTSNTVKDTKKIYTWFKSNNFNYLQFIPCLDPMITKRGKLQYSLTPKMFTKFLNDIFDCWYKDFINGKYISIRYIDNLVKIISGQNPESCDMKGHCSVQNVIEANGDIYPCDFYVMNTWNLGNIKKMNFFDVFNSEKTKKFITESFQKNSECEKCKWFSLCRNGCKRYRENNLNYYCDSYKEFFNKNIDNLLNVLKYLR